MIITAFPSFGGTRTMGDAQELEDDCITPLISISGCRCFASSRLCRGIRRTHRRIGGLFSVSTQCFTKLVRPGLSLSANRSVLAKQQQEKLLLLLWSAVNHHPLPSSRAFLIWLLKSQRSLPCLLLQQ